MGISPSWNRSGFRASVHSYSGGLRQFEEVEGSMEYKVLSQQDRRWSGKFSPENLERTLNSYAAEGWRVVSSFPVGSPWSLSTSQVMVLLERETPAS